MKTLEEIYGFHLCIHYRDFPLGGYIPETIANKMAESREIILIISNEALNSNWCDFELNQALIQTQRRRKALISIILGEINVGNLNNTWHTFYRATHISNGQKTRNCFGSFLLACYMEIEATSVVAHMGQDL
jgi:toll-like receptor 13